MSFFLLVANWIVFCSLLLRTPSFPLVLPAKECKWVVLPRHKYCPHLISYPDLLAGSPDRVRSGYEISPDHLKSFNKVTTHLLCHHFCKAVVALTLIDYFLFFTGTQSSRVLSAWHKCRQMQETGKRFVFLEEIALECTRYPVSNRFSWNLMKRAWRRTASFSSITYICRWSLRW